MLNPLENGGGEKEKAMSKVLAYMTASTVELGGTEDERSERNGWVDIDDRFFLESRPEDVRPIVNADETDTEAVREAIQDVLGDGFLWEDNGDGSFYAKDSQEHDGESFSYAVHFTLNGEAWHPERDGGISLSESVSV